MCYVYAQKEPGKSYRQRVIMNVQGSYQSVLMVIGTRPEAIKMVPVYYALKREGISTFLCSTAQHTDLLQQVFDLFSIKPDADLAVMKPGQNLAYLTSAILEKTQQLFQVIKPSIVLVQGDTTTSMAAALAAFYLKIPMGHVEAGLRTYDIDNPFPEEVNRRFISTIARYHFAPTAQAAAHLLAEGVARESVFCTGNTVVDALRLMQNNIACGYVAVRSELQEAVTRCKQEGKKIIVFTMHRRESFDGGFVRVVRAVNKLLLMHDDLFCFYPVHPNPAVTDALREIQAHDQFVMNLCAPFAYQDLVYVLTHADLIITDSGGLQEEAVSLAKPVVVTREKTERMEGVWAGLVDLVGTDEHLVQQAVIARLYEPLTYHADTTSIYGDGDAAQKIVSIIKKHVLIRTYQNDGERTVVEKGL
ncbi:UDP-N-acetylglucosamine 2-epimerase (non-hydrolyzing) [Candidatus Dependentiae bacterium]|nr:UDP-N-acetylglucosamine 2-epimerase (non-hydrolyzing) [Candidatus Dependentiae bacterium]